MLAVNRGTREQLYMGYFNKEESMRKLYIIGAGGFGREVAWLVERINEEKHIWNLQGFIDDNIENQGKIIDGYKVLGGCDYFQNLEDDIWCVCAVGSAKTRRNIVEKISNLKNIHFAILIDPSVMHSNYIDVGEGSIVCAGTILTVDISLGKHVIINLDCTIGHDVKIDDYVTVYPSANISGNVTIGTCTELGTGTQIIQGKNVASKVIIGAGTVVIRDLTESGTYVGNPAKKIK